MSINTGSLSNYFDLNALTQLEHKARNHEAKLEVAAGQLESVFLEMVMKSMREANDHLKSDMFSSNAEDMYQEMYDKQLSVTLAQMKSIGLKDVIMKQLSGYENITNMSDGIEK